MSTPPAAPANKGKGKSDKKNKNNDHSSPDNKPIQDLESGDPEKNQPEKRAHQKKMTAKTQNNDNNHNNQETLSRVALEPQATEVRLESSATTATRASSQDEPANAWGSPASPFPKSTPAEACAAEALKEPKKKVSTEHAAPPPPGEGCDASIPLQALLAQNSGSPPLFSTLSSLSLSSPLRNETAKSRTRHQRSASQPHSAPHPTPAPSRPTQPSQEN